MGTSNLHPLGEMSSAARNDSRLRLLINTGLLLSSERSLDVIVQAALDAGLQLCGGAFGAFFYNNFSKEGETYQLYKVAGIDPAAFRAYPMPRQTAIFAPTFRGDAVLRSDDITGDPRYGTNAPLTGMPPGHVPVRSYLAVPVRSRGGEVLGALLYGHPERAVFALETESLVSTVAAQAAVAIENVRLTDTLTAEIAIADAARAEQRSAELRLRQALDAAHLGTWNWDAATGLLDFDERGAELFGLEPHVPVPRDALRARLVHEQDLEKTPEDLHQILREGGRYAAEYRIELPAGTHRWIAASGNATYADGSREVNGMIGTLQDITARKAQEASLRQSEKLAATGRLAASIAHEINNPLEAVTNLIYLAKTDPDTPPGVERLLETADAELARVSHIAQQTLGFYRDTTRPSDIYLNELLAAVVDLFSRKLAGKRLVCTLDLAPGLNVTGLRGELRQVFSNLLVNAVDASPATGGSISIRGRHRHHGERHGVTILVADGGSGIPVSVRPRLFTPFMTTKEDSGTGLGLWVTRGIVEKHGGTVCFRSRTATPCGTVFRVHLPLSGDANRFALPRSGVLQ